MSADGTEQQLADFVAGLKRQDLSDSLVRAAQRCILDYLGVGIRGARDETVRILDRWIIDDHAGGNARLLGSGMHSTRQSAAMHNGVASHVLDFDDTHIPTILHPSSPICSALLPAAQQIGASGSDLLVAFVAGYEASTRIARSVFPAHYDRGWHMTGTAGVFGAAAAVACLHRLSPAQCVCALGLAATSSSGLRENFGSMAKSFHSGMAARNGLMAAELAALGYTSSSTALSGKRGFFSVMSDESDPAVIVDGLGETFELLVRHSFKPYPCGVVLHPVLDAACSLHSRVTGLDAADIDSIVANVNPYVLELTAKTDPKVGLEGKFSIYYTVSVALLRGEVGVDDFTDDAVYDKTVRALMSKVKAEPDAQMPISHARIAVNFSDGRCEEYSIEGSRGMPESPMSDTDIQKKFEGLVKPLLGPDKTGRIVNAVMDLDEVGNVGDVIPLCDAE